MLIFFSSFLINLVSFALYSSLCAIYYWVTVRNSQSYWHLEHMGETLACTQGGAGSVGGARGLQGSWMGGAGVMRQVWARMCYRVRLGIFFDISRC